VLREDPVGGDQLGALRDCLGNQQPVERVFVERGRPSTASVCASVTGRTRTPFDCCPAIICATGSRRVSFPNWALTIISQALTTLTQTSFAGSRRSARAAADSRAGSLSHQMKA